MESRQENTPRPMTSTCVLAIPSYNDIFRVPKIKDRQTNQQYGRVLLKHLFKEQHGTMLSNQRTVRSWLKDANLFEDNIDLRHNKSMQDNLKSLIREKMHTLIPLRFRGTDIKWEEEDIYNWAKVSLQSKRKNNKKKSNSISKDTSPRDEQQVRMCGYFYC